MIKKAKSKRRQLFALVVGSAFVLTVIWFGVIRSLQENVVKVDGMIADVEGEAKQARRLAERAESFETDLANANAHLQEIEARMATGDVYRWGIRTFQNLAAAAKVEIASLDPPSERTWDVLPKIPYRAVVYSMSGMAYYHDFLRFVSDLQSSLPHLRLLRLELEPAHLGGASSEEGEKLAFKLSVIVLINPASPRR